MIMEEQYRSNQTTNSLQAKHQTDEPSVLIVGEASFSQRHYSKQIIILNQEL